MGNFELVSQYKPTGDQPEAISKLVEGIKRGDKEQTLLGVTGSGKTFTMANVIAQLNRPALVLAHNKTLAAQLCSEFREFFPQDVYKRQGCIFPIDIKGPIHAVFIIICGNAVNGLDIKAIFAVFAFYHSQFH